eukprot:2168335-Amphidinium_carterae.1
MEKKWGLILKIGPGTHFVCIFFSFLFFGGLSMLAGSLTCIQTKVITGTNMFLDDFSWQRCCFVTRFETLGLGRGGGRSSVSRLVPMSVLEVTLPMVSHVQNLKKGSSSLSPLGRCVVPVVSVVLLVLIVRGVVVPVFTQLRQLEQLEQ